MVRLEVGESDGGRGAIGGSGRGWGDRGHEHAWIEVHRSIGVGVLGRVKRRRIFEGRRPKSR